MEKIITKVYVTTDKSLMSADNETFIEKCKKKGKVFTLDEFKSYIMTADLSQDIMRTISTFVDGDYYCCTNARTPENGTIEVCPICEKEVLLSDKFEKQRCPNCGQPILPCSQCEVRNCTHCPLEMRTYVVTINYCGSITQRVVAKTEYDAYAKVSSIVNEMSNTEFLTELEPREIDYNVTPID